MWATHMVTYSTKGHFLCEMSGWATVMLIFHIIPGHQKNWQSWGWIKCILIKYSHLIREDNEYFDMLQNNNIQITRWLKIPMCKIQNLAQIARSNCEAKDWDNAVHRLVFPSHCAAPCDDKVVSINSALQCNPLIVLTVSFNTICWVIPVAGRSSVQSGAIFLHNKKQIVVCCKPLAT